LLKVKNEGFKVLSTEKVQDLKISDYLVKVTPYPEMTYEEALIVAMDQEKAAFKLYSNLAVKAENGEMRELFLSLAQEESKHKLSFEIEYDEFVLREN
jgi:rubrerythrin